MKVEILFVEGCPNHAETAARVNSVAEALGLQVEIVETKVDPGRIPSGFCGSPTVLIDGVDIEPGAGQAEFLCCRAYLCRKRHQRHAFARNHQTSLGKKTAELCRARQGLLTTSLTAL